MFVNPAKCEPDRLTFYLDENYARLMLLHEVADGLHPFVQRDVLAAPNVVGHELDLPPLLGVQREFHAHSKRSNNVSI
jgi:hypothetical protein